MDIAIPILIIVNLITGLGCAIPIVKLLQKTNKKEKTFFRYFAVLIGAYFVECIAIIMGMGIPIFSIGLAIVWVMLFGYWLTNHAAKNEVLKTSLCFSLYSSLPAASFILIPVLALISGRNIINAEQGIRFGIPDYLPYPINTILGFYLVITIGALVLKTAITVAVVHVFLTVQGNQKTASNS